MTERKLERWDHETSRVPVSRCPDCGYAMDAASPVSGNADEEPRPGDLSVCLDCGAVLVFTNELGMRVATLREMNEAPPNLLRVVRIIVQRGRLTRDVTRKPVAK